MPKTRLEEFNDYRGLIQDCREGLLTKEDFNVVIEEELYFQEDVEQLRKELKEKIEECRNSEEAKDLIDSVFAKVLKED